MIVEIICVGTEILMGNIVNTNAAYLAAKCAGLGLGCSVVVPGEEPVSGYELYMIVVPMGFYEHVSMYLGLRAKLL